MARLWSSGFELNTDLTDVEWTSRSGVQTFTTTNQRSGTYALELSSLAVAKGLRYDFQSAANNGPFFFRVYGKFVTFPGVENRIILLNNTGDLTTPVVYLTIDNTGVLKLYDEDGQITGTTTLSTDTYYRIEFEIDVTAAAGSHVVKARVDGSEFAAATDRSLSAGVMSLAVGANLNSEENSTGEWYFDDIAINNNSGSFQNSYPGAGAIIHLRPNAAGDNADWTRGGTDSGANWSQTDEVTPNNATDYVESNTAEQIDDYNLDATPAAIGASDTINCVQVGVRAALSNGSGADPDVVLRIKASASGPVEESAGIGSTSPGYTTNSLNIPHNYLLTLYDLPGASTTAWTKADLDTAQIGIRESVTDTHFYRVSTLWLLVDYAPSAITDPQVSASETITLSEAVTLLMTSFIGVTETITLSETITANLISLVSVSDTITLTEAVTVLLVSLVSVDDTITFSEAVSVTVSDPQISVDDTITLSEAITLNLICLIDVSDSLTLSEVIDIIIVVSLNVSDTITLSENANVLLASLIEASDTITLSETTTLLLTSFIDASDTITLSEAVNLTIVSAGEFVISVSDTITLSEAITFLLISFIDVSETITLSEAVTMLMTSFVTVSDTITLSETTNVLLLNLIFTSDTIILSESIDLLMTSFVDVTETITLSESITMLMTRLVSVDDTIALSEAITVLLFDLISVSDTIILSETISLLMTSFVDVSDTITLSEAVIISIVTAGDLVITTSDTITLSEAVNVAIGDLQVNVSEGITLSESVNLLNILNISQSENIVLTENVSIAALALLVTVSEIITLSETITLSGLGGATVQGDPLFKGMFKGMFKKMEI